MQSCNDLPHVILECGRSDKAVLPKGPQRKASTGDWSWGPFDGGIKVQMNIFFSPLFNGKLRTWSRCTVGNHGKITSWTGVVKDLS